jgi:predicted Co/Zn/Cd cation transporter (cation efflux family)
MDERLADNINDDPVVYMDCTMPQILWTGAVSTVISLVIGFVIGMLFGSFAIGFVIGILASLGLSWLGLTLIQNLRHTNFDGWLNEKMFLIKHNLLVTLGMESKLIQGSERMSKGARK